METMDDELAALRKQIAALPDEERAAAIFAIEAIEDELAARSIEQMAVAKVDSPVA